MSSPDNSLHQSEVYQLLILFETMVGTVFVLRTWRAWWLSYSQLNVVLRAYMWLTITDTMVVATYLGDSFYRTAIASTRIVDGVWCQTSAFTGMTISLVVITVNLVATLATLCLLKGQPMTPLHVHSLIGLGWLGAVLVSCLYLSEGAFGPHPSGLYCMIAAPGWSRPSILLAMLIGYVQHGIILVIVNQAYGLVGAWEGVPQPSLFTRFVVLPIMALRNSSSSSNNNHNPEGANGGAHYLTRSNTYRARASRIIIAHNVMVFASYWIAYGFIYISAMLRASRIELPVAFEVAAGLLVKSQPIMHSIYFLGQLDKFAERALLKMQPKVQPGIDDAEDLPEQYLLAASMDYLSRHTTEEQELRLRHQHGVQSAGLARQNALSDKRQSWPTVDPFGSLSTSSWGQGGLSGSWKQMMGFFSGKNSRLVTPLIPPLPGGDGDQGESGAVEMQVEPRRGSDLVVEGPIPFRGTLEEQQLQRSSDTL